MFGEPTTIPAVLSAITAQVISQTAYDSSQVFMSLADDDDISSFPPKDVFVQVAPRDGTPRPGDVEGGGAGLFTVDLIIAVNLWVRLGLDVVYQDADLLTNATAGQLAQWLKVMKALQTFYPAAASGVAASIFVEPMRNVKFAFQPRQPANGWSKLPSWWKVSAVLNLS